MWTEMGRELGCRFGKKMKVGVNQDQESHG